MIRPGFSLVTLFALGCALSVQANVVEPIDVSTSAEISLPPTGPAFCGYTSRMIINNGAGGAAMVVLTVQTLHVEGAPRSIRAVHIQLATKETPESDASYPKLSRGFVAPNDMRWRIVLSSSPDDSAETTGLFKTITDDALGLEFAMLATPIHGASPKLLVGFTEQSPVAIDRVVRFSPVLSPDDQETVKACLGQLRARVRDVIDAGEDALDANENG